MATRDMPAAEVDVTPELVRALLSQQRPELAARPLQLLTNGWDNAIYRLGEDLLVRLPRRAAAADLLRHEQLWLPHLAPLLPLPVPVPVHAGVPCAAYPWPWSIVPFRPGEPAARTPPTDPEATARTIGRFLAALHRPATGDFPANPVRGIPLAARDHIVRANLGAIDGIVDAEIFAQIWDDALSLPVWDRVPVWLHGDLHPANLLVHDGRLSAVIDFGDITAGDPATDLSIAWMLLPTTSHTTLRDAYVDAGGPLDEATWLRARAWAVGLGAVFVAHSADNPMMHDVGLRTLATLGGESAQHR